MRSPMHARLIIAVVLLLASPSHAWRAAARIGRCALAPLLIWPSCVTAAPLSGEEIFEARCVGCHVGGANVVGYARAKTLQKQALETNGYATPEAIVTLLTEGKGVMPRYGSYVSKKTGELKPAQLSDEEMARVADYVLQRAEAGWN